MEKQGSQQVYEVTIGDEDTAEKAVHLMESIPEHLQLHVGFSNISGWVPARIGPPSMRQQLKNIGHSADKGPEKQVRLSLKVLSAMWEVVQEVVQVV